MYLSYQLYKIASELFVPSLTFSNSPIYFLELFRIIYEPHQAKRKISFTNNKSKYV